MLDSKQLTALRLAEDLNSFFLTGDPGTSKTFTLLKIIEVLSTLLKPSQLGITASTGAAANRLQDQKQLLLSVPVGSIVQLKVGVCIVLHKNIGKGLFNGSMGIILDFYSSYHILPPDNRAEKPQTLHSIHNIKVDNNSPLIHALPGPVCTLRGREQMLFLLVKFEIGSMHKHVLVLNEEFVFQAVKGNKEYTAMHFSSPWFDPWFLHQPELDWKAVLSSTYSWTILFWFDLPKPFQILVNFNFDFDNIGLNIRLSSSGFVL
ncbi:hypothetical protein BDR05DRAFT_1003485 [Suillus weaverae]|nr:hypothetical protein BDR05DRAFT_1003485 [Suillus weaverae]